jgi:hypothetical protein
MRLVVCEAATGGGHVSVMCMSSTAVNTVTRIPKQAGLPRLALCATLDLCLPKKQELRGALSAETDSEDRNTLTNPLTPADRQTWVVARAPRDLLLLLCFHYSLHKLVTDLSWAERRDSVLVE